MAKNYFGITDTGKLRNNNEDTFIAETVLNGQYIVASVIDGVGGYEGGEVAAKLAHDAILQHLSNASTDVIEQLKGAVAAANSSIYEEKSHSKKNEQMACVLTLAMADVTNNKFYYAHVGDTRLYLFRDSSLVKVTRDHSFVGFLEDSGRLTEEAAMKHPKRNEINKALGFDDHIQTDYIETGESPFLPGDMLLLCSDGLSDMIGNSTITSILNTDKNLASKGKSLIDAANDAGGKDNITVVLVENDKEPVKQEATKPASARTNEVDRTGRAVELKTDKDPVTFHETPKKRKRSTVPVLLFLCILFLGAFLWMVYKDFYKGTSAGQQTTNAVATTRPDENVQRLLDSINDPAKKEVFVMHLPDGKPIVLADSISITKDSLHIIGNGVTLVSDSTYKGAAFSLAANCKYVLLDSITLQNFDVGIVARNQALHLKNVQFKNVGTPVQYHFGLPNNQVVNGRFADTMFYNADSLSKK